MLKELEELSANGSDVLHEEDCEGNFAAMSFIYQKINGKYIINVNFNRENKFLIIHRKKIATIGLSNHNQMQLSCFIALQLTNYIIIKMLPRPQPSTKVAET